MQEQDSMRSEIEDKVTELAAFGLTPLQSRMYIHLLLHGPCFAKSISSGLGINRADAHRILHGLVNKGLLEVKLPTSTSTKYMAIEPQKAMRILLDEAELQLSRLRRREVDLVKWLQSISGVRAALDPPIDNNFDHFKLKHGRNVFDTWRKLIDDSQSEIRKVWSKEGLHLHCTQGFFDHFRNAAGRGVNIIGVTEHSPSNEDEINILSQFASVRLNKNLESYLRYMIVDRRQVFVNATSWPSSLDDFTALWSDNRAIVEGFTTDFERLWQSSVPFQKVFQ